MRAELPEIDDSDLELDEESYLYEDLDEFSCGGEDKDYELTMLSFTLGGDWYAVDADGVREVIDLPPVTRLPHVPEHVLGIVNVRGSVRPVVDVLRLMRTGRTELGAGSRLVVAEAAGATMGIIVDAVGAMWRIPIENIRPPLSRASGSDTAFSRGQVKLADGTVVTLLDMEQVIRSDRLERLE